MLYRIAVHAEKNMKIVTFTLVKIVTFNLKVVKN